MAKGRRGNNEGSIFQRESNGRWRAQISINGRRLSFTAATRRECQEWLRKTRDQVDVGLNYERSKITLEEFLKEWLIAIEPDHSKRTIELYQWTINKRILPKMGRTVLKDITRDRIQFFYNYLRNSKGLSTHSVHSTHTVLRAALNHAKKLGLVTENVCSVVGFPRPKRKKPKVLDEDQVVHFLNFAVAMDDRHCHMYYLALHTGMRMGELLGLMWKDVAWDEVSLQVNRQAVFPKGGGFDFVTPKSDSGIRKIVLGKHALRSLSNQMRVVAKLKQEAGHGWRENDLVFPSKAGTPIQHCNVRRNFYKTLEASGLPRIRFHDLRHTAATMMLNNGIPIKVVSDRIGHAKASFTMDVYAHALPNKQEEAARLMDNLLTPLDVTNCTIFAPGNPPE